MVFLITGNVFGKDASDFSSGNDLLTKCRNFEKEKGSIQEAYDTGFCHAYIRGVADAIKNIVMCTPSGVTYEQIWRVVIKYLQNHPEELHLSPNFLIQKALEKAFPCK
jgi:hypothetical protein